jgi:Protein of unknown function (DUF2892)
MPALQAATRTSAPGDPGGRRQKVSSFVPFMQSAAGRLLRIVAGAALIAIGIWLVGGTWGIILAVIGAVPLIAGLTGICLFAPLFGYTLTGEPRSHASH